MKKAMVRRGQIPSVRSFWSHEAHRDCRMTVTNPVSQEGQAVPTETYDTLDSKSFIIVLLHLSLRRTCLRILLECNSPACWPWRAPGQDQP